MMANPQLHRTYCLRPDAICCMQETSLSAVPPALFPYAFYPLPACVSAPAVLQTLSSLFPCGLPHLHEVLQVIHPAFSCIPHPFAFPPGAAGITIPQPKCKAGTPVSIPDWPGTGKSQSLPRLHQGCRWKSHHRSGAGRGGKTHLP